MTRRLTEGEKGKIVGAYLSGSNINVLAKIFKHDNYLISGILKERRVFRSKSEGIVFGHQLHRKNLVGKKFGRWLVIREVEEKKYDRQYQYLCRCDCGREKIVAKYYLTSGDSRSCGCLARELTSQRQRLMVGRRNPNWKSGRYLDKDGYVILTGPFDVYGRKYRKISEHVLIMSEHLGRSLFPDETVHHKNGIKNDNRLENLELWVASHLHGQRVSDMVKFCEDYLKTYKPEVLVSKQEVKA